MIKDIKNAGDHNFSRRDGFQTLKEAFNDGESAFDFIGVNSLVPVRYTGYTLEMQTLGDGTEDVKYIMFWGHGETESNQLEIGDGPLGSTEKTTLNFFELNPAILSGTYFFIYDDAGSVCVWFNLDNGDTQPVVIANRYIEVDISTGNSASDIALATANSLHTDSEFTAVNSTTYVMAASVSSGNKDNATDGDSGVSITVTNGTESINGKYVYVYDSDNNKYHIWWNVNATGADPDPDPGNSTPIEITLDLAETPTTIATKTATEINNVDVFISYNENEYIIVKNVEDSDSNGIVDGDTGYVVTNIKKGEDKPLVLKLQVFYSDNYCINRIARVNDARII